MSLFGTFDVAASGLSAQRLRMDVTAENLANAQSTRGADGGPYRRKEVVLREASGGSSFGAALAGARGGAAAGGAGGVEVAAVVPSQAAPKRVHDPGHPDADADGNVLMPDINPVTEMVDLIGAQRAYEANVTAMQSAKSMFSKTLELLR